MNTCSSTSEVRLTSEACLRALDENLKPELFRALCDPSRIAVICRLATTSRPLTVTEVADCCGVHLSGISRHLSILRKAGVVTATRQGREVRYQLDCSHLSKTLRGLAAAFDACQAGCCRGDDNHASDHVSEDSDPSP